MAPNHLIGVGISLTVIEYMPIQTIYETIEYLQ